MAMQTVRVVADIRARGEKRDEVLTLLRKLVEPTKREAGCLEYDLHVNLEDDRQFTFVEEWESQAALDAHLQADHVRPVLELLPPLLESPPSIRRFVRVSGSS